MHISFMRLAIVLGVLLLSILSIIYVTPLLTPFIIGLLIALILNPLVERLEKKMKFPRWFAVSFALLLFIILFMGIIVLIIAEISIELFQLSQIVPQYINQFTEYLQASFTNEQIQFLYDRIQGWYGTLDPNYKNQIEIKIESWLSVISTASIDIIKGFLNGLADIIASLPNMATIFVISILAAFFISKDLQKLKRGFLRLIPEKVQKGADNVLQDLKKAMGGFLKAQLTLISITALIVTIGLIILRVEYAITIGLITGIVDLLPYLGTGAVFVPWIIYLFITKQFSLVIGLSILYGIIVVMRQILEPKVLAESVGIDPLASLISLFVGLKLFGFLGLIIGPISIVIFQALLKANIFTDLWNYIKKEPRF